MRYLCTALLLLFVSPRLLAQSDTAGIKKTIDKLFTSMRNADSVSLRECFAPEAIMQTIKNDKDGQPGVSNGSVASFAMAIGKLPKDAADERITYGNILIDADLAVVWTPYQFYFKQQLSHCGVNSFQLVKLGGTWKIQYLIDTRRKTGCAETSR